MGVVLGLIGGGGSILTVPILKYMAGQEAIVATAYSLVIVGASALAGSATYIRKQLVDFRTAFVFGLPAIAGVYLTRKFVVPALPAELFTIGGLTVTNDLAIMLLFALIMLAASYSMIRGRKSEDAETSGTEGISYNYPLILGEGLIVGGITGLVGAGGGFLIIPALVTLAKLPMKLAVGTSLLIISMKSLLGVVGSMTIAGGEVALLSGDGAPVPLQWGFLAAFVAASIAGILGGAYLSKFIPGSKLKPGFGWFMLAMGIVIIGSELYQS
jgi:uncharacterized membrane protein YfcA